MKVKFHNPEFPNDLEFDVGGLVLVNNKTVEFDKDQLDRYKAQHGVSLKDRLLTNEYATVDGRQGKVTYLHPAEDEPTETPEPEKEGDK
jgi:hypothetical protein